MASSVLARFSGLALTSRTAALTPPPRARTPHDPAPALVAVVCAFVRSIGEPQIRRLT
jgi:hypothetical protein